MSRKRRGVSPRAVLSSLREALDARDRELAAERADASAERARAIDAEREAIERRREELSLVENLGKVGLPELRRLGQPLPLARRVRKVTTPDGYRLETVDSGKRVACRCWREGEARPSTPQIVLNAGPYLPCVAIPLEEIEHTAWCMASGWDGR